MLSDIEHSLPDDATLPLIVVPKVKPFQPVSWMREHKEWVQARLRQHGAILFREFSIGLENFSEFAAAASDSLQGFADESSPRSRISGEIFTSTDYPRAFPIQFHSEFSYSSRWPMSVFFHCVEAPGSGGATPIADTRQVLARISTRSRQKFEECGVLYRRNFLSYMGMSWQRAFGTSNKAEVNDYLLAHGIEAHWREPDELRTQWTTPAIVTHPQTRELVWFNHAFFFNLGAIEPIEVRRALSAQKEYSTNTYFGDGSIIDQQIIEELRQAYAAASVEIPWRRGDVLQLNNMLTAHSRRPYTGQRRIVVAMSEPYTRADLALSDNTTTC